MTESIYTIEVKGKKLNVIYSKQEYGLYSFFSSDKRIEEYISNFPDDAYFDAVSLEEDGTYLINIASVADLGAFEWKNASELLHRQLSIYTPIIQKFIEDVVIEKL